MWQRRNKYGAVKEKAYGYTFGSKLERAVFEILKLQEIAGEIKIAQVQDTVYLAEHDNYRGVKYIPDFRCTNLMGDDFWVEAKGFEAQRWPTIKSLWKGWGPGILMIYKGSHIKPYLDETITPVMRKL